MSPHIYSSFGDILRFGVDLVKAVSDPVGAIIRAFSDIVSSLLSALLTKTISIAFTDSLTSSDNKLVQAVYGRALVSA